MQRILGLADALVGGDQHVDAAPQRGQLGHRRARLLEVLEWAVSGQRGGRRDGLVDAPAAVGVDAHRRHQRANGVDARHVVGKGLAGLGHFDLRGARAGKPGQHLGHLVCRDGRHGRVDRDAVAPDVGCCLVRRLDGRRQPMHRLGRLVFEECPELTPARPGPR